MKEIIVTQLPTGNYVARIAGENKLTHRRLASTPARAILQVLTAFGDELGVKIKLEEGIEVRWS